MVNAILKNENYTGTLFQGKRRKLNYRVNKQIELDKENWIITTNHHEAIISKENFDKVQDIDLSEVNIDEVDDLNEIRINRRKTKEERIIDFISKTKNPYIFKVNGRLVRFSFSENGPTADECLTRMLKNLYR